MPPRNEGISTGPDKLVVIFAVALLFLGPKELPALTHKIGELRHQLRTMQNTFRSELNPMTQLTNEPPTHTPNTNQPDIDPTSGSSFI